jgi:mannose-6-phosphate isomerase-like protein (cupin superfamily)
MRDNRTMSDAVFDLSHFPVHLGLGARVVRLEEFDGSPDWYQRYGSSVAGDGLEGRLVSMHTFSESWDTWEMHPNGDELVACVAGSIVLHQEIDGEQHTVELQAGEAVVNPPGTWHTADVTGPCTAFFITAGAGTEIRPR